MTQTVAMASTPSLEWTTTTQHICSGKIEFVEYPGNLPSDTNQSKFNLTRYMLKFVGHTGLHAGCSMQSATKGKN